jgi:hypothetical protein
LSRMQKRFRTRAEILRDRRRMRRPFIVGTCSNCREKETAVKRIAGCLVCHKCARRLPGHLLRFYFPSYGKLYSESEAITAGMPAPPKKEKLSWTKNVARKFADLWRVIARKFGRRRPPTP